MKKIFPFYLLAVSIFLLMISPFLLSRGMFLDGIVYANFAKNFAIGDGTFLHPFYSETYLTNFVSHPPMFFFLEGLFFKLFGTSFLVERFYSVLCLLITGFVTIKLYKKLEFKNTFLPLFFLVSIPLITWSAANNIIENTLMIFTTLSVLFYIYSFEKKRFLFLFLAGLSISIGFSLKGFVALFPYSFPFIYWLIIRKNNFKRVLFDTVLIIIFSITPILVSILYSPEINGYFISYFKTQIIGSISSIQTVDSRFYILGRFLSEIIPSIIICGLYGLIIKLKTKSYPLISKDNSKKALMIFLFSLTAVLPIMISMKQSGFYLLPAFPFLAIAFSALIDNSVEDLLSKLDIKSNPYYWIKYISIGLFVVSIILPVFFYGKDNRDKKLLSDMDIIANYLPPKSIVNVSKEMEEEYSLFAYYARFHNISLDPNINNKRKYILIRKEYNNNFEELNYKKVKLETESFNLYEKEN